MKRSGGMQGSHWSVLNEKEFGNHDHALELCFSNFL
jgi:hypothetical protein